MNSGNTIILDVSNVHIFYFTKFLWIVQQSLAY